jgi:hypothetical protein
MGDDGRGIALFMRLFGLPGIRCRMVERSRFQPFAARLLPQRIIAEAWIAPTRSPIRHPLETALVVLSQSQCREPQ